MIGTYSGVAFQLKPVGVVIAGCIEAKHCLLVSNIVCCYRSSCCKSVEMMIKTHLKQLPPQFFTQLLVALNLRISQLTQMKVIKDDKTEENTFEILQHSDRNINNS